MYKIKPIFLCNRNAAQNTKGFFRLINHIQASNVLQENNYDYAAKYTSNITIVVRISYSYNSVLINFGCLVSFFNFVISLE